ncbi:MAG: protein kinase, partial [Anaerolineae bacterium]|nr:protein kinase [Phycisphaerae bacterium]
QREPVQRRVALKVIKLGMDTREVVARFQAERQALAMMDHPSISRVFEAGATDAGRPFFAMELVSGVPITRFCDEQQLSTQDRLTLFATVCEAVQHAHAKGVIHRDIKPGNVLVAMIDGKPVPKVIDFGIAKAISQRLTERTIFTQMGRMVGTPEYMSPEQANSSPMDVDTRTDIYSLGVLLYELLTGTLPFDAKTLRSHAHDEIQRIIREVEPPHPSTRLGKLDSADADVRAKRRQESVISLTSALRRELEWIPLKAMRKDREQRYRTASEMADDVRNYLLGRPLVAGPETRAYRTRKFLRRNRVTVVTAAIMLALLVGGIVATTLQAVRATRAERQAEQRLTDVRALASNLISDLHPQIEQLAGASGASKALVDTSLKYLNKLAAQSSNDPALLREMSSAYQKLGDIQGNPNVANRGDVAAAAKSYERARETAQQGLALPSVTSVERTRLTNALAGAEMKIGDVLQATSKPREALPRFIEGSRLMEQLATAEPKSFRARYNLVIAIPRVSNVQLSMGDVAAASETTNRQVALAQSLVRDFPNQPEAKGLLGTAYSDLADVATRAGRNADALNALEQSVELHRQVAADQPDNVFSQDRLASTYLLYADALNESGQLDRAIDASGQGIEIARHMAKLDPLNLHSRNVLGRILMRTGDFNMMKEKYDLSAANFAEGIEVYKKSLEIAPKNPGATQMLVVTYGQLAELECLRERFDASIAAHQAGIDLLMPLVKAAPDNITLRGGLAFALRIEAETMLSANQPENAVARLREAMDIQLKIAKASPSDDRASRNWLITQYALARALIALADQAERPVNQRTQDRAEARSLLQSCLTEYEKRASAGKLAAKEAEMIEKIKQKFTALDAPTTGPATGPTTNP